MSEAKGKGRVGMAGTDWWGWRLVPHHDSRPSLANSSVDILFYDAYWNAILYESKCRNKAGGTSTDL
jgi:hypothetical protein